jgi:hypothetical protein
MEIPASGLPFHERSNSAEFKELHEHVKRVAFSVSSMNREEQNVVEEGALS